jgi:hypothetical protein
VDAELDPTVIESGRRRILLGPCLSAAAILLSFVNPLLSLATYVSYPVVYIFPGRIDALWRRQEVN